MKNSGKLHVSTRKLSPAKPILSYRKKQIISMPFVNVISVQAIIIVEIGVTHKRQNI